MARLRSSSVSASFVKSITSVVEIERRSVRSASRRTVAKRHVPLLLFAQPWPEVGGRPGGGAYAGLFGTSQPDVLDWFAGPWKGTIAFEDACEVEPAGGFCGMQQSQDKDRSQLERIP